MPKTTSNMRGTRLAQIALEAYFSGRTELRKGGALAPNLDWSQTDIVDLIADLLILARLKGYDVTTLLSTVRMHIAVETLDQQ